MATQPATVDVDMHEIDELLEQAKRGPLTEAQCTLLRELAVSYFSLTGMVKDRDTTLAQLRNLLFGSGSEKTEALRTQLGQRDPVGKAAAPATGDDQSAKPAAPPRKGHGRNGASAYTGAETVAVPHASLNVGSCCPGCNKGKLAQQDPEKLIRTTAQAPLLSRIFEVARFRCRTCGQVFKAATPPEIGNKKYDTKSASMIALLRYGSGLPHNRIQKLQGDFRMPLPASTQYEIVADASVPMQPAYDEFLRQAAQGEVIHNDDTKAVILQVLRERAAAAEDRADQADQRGKADHDGRTGTFTTGIVSVGEHRIVLFFTGRQHAGENLADLLRRRSSDLGPPLQMCDALDRNLPAGLSTVLSNCLSHGRRQFVDVAQSFPAECLHVLDSLRQVYHNDDLAKQQRLSSAQRLRFHQEHSEPVMMALEKWLRTQLEEHLVEPNSGLGKAINYVLKRWQQLTLFLRVAGAPLDNNVCERALKMAIVHRKNSLFYKTMNGARVGDLYMTLINTARLCGANPFEYLTALQDNAAGVRANPSAWMPWCYRDSLPPVANAP